MHATVQRMVRDDASMMDDGSVAARDSSRLVSRRGSSKEGDLNDSAITH